MLNKLITVCMIIVFAATLLIACEGSPDRSLALEAYPPVDQTNDKDRPVMENVTKARLGVFEQSGSNFINRSTFNFDDLDASMSLDNLPKTDTQKFTYVLEGFGASKIESTIECDLTNSTSCDDGWSCERNAQSLTMCARNMENAVVARGISAPTAYNGSDAVSIKMLFSRLPEFGMMTKTDGEAALMASEVSGGKALKLPDNNVLIIGGENKAGTRAPTFPGGAFLFNPETNSFEDVEVSGWSGGRSFFEFIHLRDIVPEEGSETSAMQSEFIIIGGQKADGITNEIYKGVYNSENKTVTMTAFPTSMPALIHHTATLLQGKADADYNGKILIVGGGSPAVPGDINSALTATSGAYLLNPADGSLSAVAGALAKARYNHSATAMPGGRVVVVGGVSTEEYTVTQIEVFVPEEMKFRTDLYSLSDTEQDYSNIANRAGHIAVPLAEYQENGLVNETDWEKARIAIIGGFRYNADDKKATTKYYYNLKKSTGSNTVTIAYVDYNGKVYERIWTPNPGYFNSMLHGQGATPHPTVDSEWMWLGDSKDTIIVLGGRQDNDKEFSDWAEIISFGQGTGDALYTFKEFKFGPASQDKTATPLRISKMISSRCYFAATTLNTGQILVVGGSTYDGREQKSLKSSEIFNPPTYNVYGGRFQPLTDF